MDECKECGSTKKPDVDIYTTLDSASYCGSCGSQLIHTAGKPRAKSSKNPKNPLTDISQDKAKQK